MLIIIAVTLFMTLIVVWCADDKGRVPDEEWEERDERISETEK